MAFHVALVVAPEAGAQKSVAYATADGTATADVGYGLSGPLGLGTVTPFAGLELAGEDARTWRAGARWQPVPNVSLDLEGTRSETANDDAPEHGVMLRGTVRS